MRSQRMIGSAMLLLAALIWGGSFTAQSVSMDLVGPHTLQACRLLLGSAVLTPVIYLRSRAKRRAGAQKKPGEGRRTVLGGICCGAMLGVAANLQQIGMHTMQQVELQQNVAGKAAFISAMYVLIVPLASVLLGKRTGARTLIATLIGAAGLYLLCMQGGGFTIGRGDGIVMLSAVFFAGHILVIDHFSDVSGVELSCLQFLVAGILSSVLMFSLETPTWAGIVSCWGPIAYMGVMSCGIAYTFQIIGQKYVPASAASLLLSMESVFSVLCGMLVLRQIPTPREAIGCAVMLAAIVLCQLPGKNSDQ